MKFIWDPAKSKHNEAKHGINFEEAKTAFQDDYFVAFVDPDHSIEEHRFILVGRSAEGRILVVSYTERGRSIRIISAREATRRERITYEEEL